MDSSTESQNQSTLKTMGYSIFLTLVAKDRVFKTFGHDVKNWPDNNFWAVISAARADIKFKDIPALMKTYGIGQLLEVPPEIVQEHQNETPD